MHVIRRSLVVLIAIVFALGVAAKAQAPQDRQPTPAPQAPAPQDRQPTPAPQAPAQQAPAQSVQSAQGELLSVDTQASTFAIKAASGEMTFRYDDNTKVAGGQKGVAGLATMKGSQVTVQFRKDGAANIATSIEVRGGEQAPKK